MWSLHNRNFVLILLVVLVAAGCGSRVLIRDDFELNGLHEWQLESDPFGRTVIADGRLYVQVNEPNTMQYTTLKSAQYDDFVVTVEATLLKGSNDSSYGILFRMQSDGGLYRFEVANRGQYMIERRDAAGRWQRLTPSEQWEYNDAIHVGLNAMNMIRVAAVGNNVIFSVNDVVVQSFENDTFDIAYPQGLIGLDAGTYSGTQTQVAFDNFVIEEP